MNEQTKNDQISTKAEKKGDDKKEIDDLCQKLGFQSQPTDIKQLGQKKSGHHRLLKLSFSNQFDARTFRAHFDEKRKSCDDIPKWRVEIRGYVPSAMVNSLAMTVK